MGNSRYYAYIGTNSVRGSLGIYTIAIDADTFAADIVASHPAYNSGALALGPNDKCLYVAVEGMTFRGLADGGVTAYGIGENGVLTEIGGAPSHGQRTCSVAVDAAGRNLYAANFYRGSLAMFPLAGDGRPLPARVVVDGPKEVSGLFRALHCVAPIGEDFVGAISLTEGALVIYSAVNGARVTDFTFPGGTFPRTLEVCGDCLYALIQDPGDVYVFRNRLGTEGRIEHLQTLSVQRGDFSGPFGASAIRATPNGRLMLAATRRANTLTVFRVQTDGTLALGDIVPLPRQIPRDFHISRDGRIAVTALQKSNAVCVHEIDYENATLRDTGSIVTIPSPAAVAVGGVGTSCKA